MKDQSGFPSLILVSALLCLFTLNQVIAQPGPPPVPEPPGGSYTNNTGGYQSNTPEFPGEGGAEGGDEGPSYPPAYNYTNGLWLEIITNDTYYVTSYLNLHGTEAGKHYEIWTNSNLSSNIWSFETALFGADDVTPFAAPYLENTNLFYIASRSPDPLTIQFPRTYVTSNTLSGVVTGGTADHIAFLINSTNFNAATWTNFTTNPTITLGNTNGSYEVWFGYSQNGLTNWSATQIVVDTIAPVLTVTNPVSFTTSRSVIQIQGFASEDLVKLSYSLANAFTNIEANGLIVSQFFDTNLFKSTTNYFQFFDVRLASGTNRITVTAADRAGNVCTTNLDFTLSLAGDTTAPIITIDWPTNNTRILGDSFTLRGHVDDPTAQVVGQMITNGITNIFTADVDRTGQFWLKDMPVSNGTNSINVTAIDAATNSSSKTITVQRSGLSVSVQGIVGSYIYGTINSNNYTVWVNGTQMNSLSGGTAWGGNANLALPTIQVRAYPPGQAPSSGSAGNNSDPANNNPPNSQASDFELSHEIPAKITTDGYFKRYSATVYNSSGSLQLHEERYTEWSSKGGGIDWAYTQYFVPGSLWDLCWYTNIYPGTATEHCENSLFENGGWGVSGGIPTEQEIATYDYSGTGLIAPYYTHGTGTIKRTASSQIVLETSKENSAKRTKGYVIHIDSHDLAAVQILNDPGDFSQVPQNIQPANLSDSTILGKPLDSDGNVYVTLPIGERFYVTPLPPKGGYAKLGVSVQSPKRVQMTWLAHPLSSGTATIEAMQAKFDFGASFLAEDDDAPPALTEAEAKAQGKLGSDDVPLYVEFTITNSTGVWGDVTNVSSGVTNIYHFSEGRYFEGVTSDDQADLIKYATFSQIKQVKSLVGAGGVTICGSNSIVFPYDDLTSLATVHEWGHTMGLSHRGFTNTLCVANPGSGNLSEDYKAIMWKSNTVDQVKINRYERQVMLSH